MIDLKAKDQENLKKQKNKETKNAIGKILGAAVPILIGIFFRKYVGKKS